MAFPCWDEPLFKATFSVTMLSQDSTVNISNMSAKAEQPYSSSVENVGLSKLMKTFPDLLEGAWKVTEFERTPRVRPSYFWNGKSRRAKFFLDVHIHCCFL